MKRIGLFGGSFDPVHAGHLLVAFSACEELALDRLFFVPAAQSPFKPGTQPAPPSIRLRMLRLALAGNPHYEIDAQEIERGGSSYTIDTVRDYARRFPNSELFYMIGADHIPTLPKWREAEALSQLAQFVVLPRPGEPCADAPSPFRVNQLKGWPIGLSSSEIRARVKAGLPLGPLVPFGVEQVIQGAGIYRG